MDFSYFTLRDNRYPDNLRTPEQLIGSLLYPEVRG